MNFKRVLPPDSGEIVSLNNFSDMRLLAFSYSEKRIVFSLDLEEQLAEIHMNTSLIFSGFAISQIAYIENVIVRKICPELLNETDIKNLFCIFDEYHVSTILRCINDPNDEFILVSIEGVSGIKMHCLCKAFYFRNSINKNFKKPPETPEQKERAEQIKNMLSGIAASGPMTNDEFFKRVSIAQKERHYKQ